MLFIFPRNKGTGVWYKQNFTSHHFGHLCFDPWIVTDNSQELFLGTFSVAFSCTFLTFFHHALSVSYILCLFEYLQRFWGINSALCGAMCTLPCALALLGFGESWAIATPAQDPQQKPKQTVTSKGSALPRQEFNLEKHQEGPGWQERFGIFHRKGETPKQRIYII